ncbi:MAG: aminopeptidase, partial [Actinobacteria bacterium]|nr:aminopeptidase [Actinomycetota bacterium]
MVDPRIVKLAENLVNYSCKVKKGERVLIECVGTSAIPLVKELIKQIYKTGAEPFTSLKEPSITREILKSCNKKQMEFMAQCELVTIKGVDAFIGIRAGDNVSELNDVPSENMNTYMKYYSKPVSDERINNTKWVVVRYPNNAMAQLAGFSLEAFEDFYFDVCNLDYDKMSKAMDNLVNLMNRTDKVRITGKNTDITFSIKGIPSVKCAGEYNIPDGEVFTAPIKESVNGKIAFNCPAVYQGFTYENIFLEFRDGKIVNAEANDIKRFNEILNIDEGARYIGEFAIGLNPYITKPIKDILFDEKIMGSFHLTPGNCYKEAFNGNESAIHLDLI